MQCNDIIVLFSLYLKVIALPHLECCVHPHNSEISKRLRREFNNYQKYGSASLWGWTHRLVSIHLLKHIFAWISEVYNIKRNTEMVNKNWLCLTIQDLGTSDQTRRFPMSAFFNMQVVLFNMPNSCMFFTALDSCVSFPIACIAQLLQLYKYYLFDFREVFKSNCQSMVMLWLNKYCYCSAS